MTGLVLQDLRPSDTGRAVIWTSGHGEPERGVVSSWNREFVFVMFPRSPGSKACRPEDLAWEQPSARVPLRTCPDGAKCHFGCGDREPCRMARVAR